MNSVECVKKICRERGIRISRLEKDLGFANGYISQLKKGVFPDDRLIMIADYLGVDPWYLSSGAEEIPEIKKPVTVSDGKSADDDRHEYVNKLFDQLTFENQILAVDYLKKLSQSQ